MQPISVREFYDGKSIMITGGTGFMGKVLLEKLLRSCPGIKRIYVISRSKRAKCPTTRLQEMTKLPLFQKLLKTYPDAFDKVRPVVGDLTENDLGMRWESRDELIAEVEILFNLGASLRLEADLKDHVSTNLSGTKRVLELAEKMKKLQAFVHVSTAFCQCEVDVVEEKIFPSSVNPHAVIDLSEWLSKKEITDKLLGEHPNCYTFTKNLAEVVVAEYKDIFPVTILRPAVVIPTHHEPFPGWVDNLNGPIGILAAAGKGVLRSMMCGPDNIAQFVPCDVAINAIILSAYRRAIDKNEKEVPVFNALSSQEAPLTYNDLMEKGKKLLVEYPVNPGLWYLGGSITTNRFVHRSKVFLFQWLPALIIDLLLLIFGQKTFMIRVQNKVKVGCEVLEYFTMRPWTIKVDKFLSLHDHISDEEKEIFFLENIDKNADEILKNSIIGTKVHCLKEPLETLSSARRLLKVYWAVDKLAKGFLLYHLVVFIFNLYTALADATIHVSNLPIQALQ